jgi:hypothetical protein
VGHHAGGTSGTTGLVLGGSGGDTHGPISTVDALHLGQSALLVLLAGESDEPIAAGHAADGIGHDLRILTGRILVLEENQKGVFIDLGTEVTNEDGVLGATVAGTIVAGQSQLSRDTGTRIG